MEVARFIGMENIFTGTVVNNDNDRSQMSFGSAAILLPGAYPSVT